jgi:aspartyl-tRNA(Asn)/glutamyl-tRNA(Gln) amidotransferase subunit A
VAELRSAGARLTGTTRLHEFAFGTTGIDRAFGMPANPAGPGRIPGGSSSGAAVVVARGEADLSLGTDTGGSVRIPAALCGVVGLKPTYGALSTVGVVPLAPSLDHVGLLVASPQRLVAPARVLRLLDDGPLPSPRRLGVAVGAADLCDPDVAAAFHEARGRVEGAGLELVEVDWPGGEEVFAATTAVMYAEAAHGHHRRLAARHQLYGEDVRGRLLQGLALQATTYLAARDLQAELRRRCRAVLERVDGVLTPTVPMVAPRVEEIADPAVAARLVTFTRLADVVGLPAVSVPLPPVGPAPPDRPALPVGLQIEGAADAAVIGAALALGDIVSG